ILMPYAYSVAREAVDGLPMIRAMFLADPNAYTYGKATQYQFLYGPNFLVAPIYQNTKMDEEGNDIRHGIYLPQGDWIDYFSGELYQGNRVLNSFEAPMWKLPVFVKAGAIIPITNANNNVYEIDTKRRTYEIYPAGGYSTFTEYDDDGTTQAYQHGQGVTTRIESTVKGQQAKVVVHPSEGSFEGMVTDKTTAFVVNMTRKPKKVSVKVGNKNIRLHEVPSSDELEKTDNSYYFDEKPDLNRFSTAGTPFVDFKIHKTPQLHVRVQATDILSNSVQLEIQGFEFNPTNGLLSRTGALSAPANVQVKEENIQAYAMKPTWDWVSNADYYEIEFNDMLYSTIWDTVLLFDNLQPVTDYTFKVRAVNKDGVSDWATVQATTKSNPLEFAIVGIVGETSVANQGGNDIRKLLDFDEGNLRHTKWGQQAVPFDMILDLKSFNQLDKFHYLPRTGGGNGILTKGKVYYSNNKEDWSEAGAFTWERNDETKVL